MITYDDAAFERFCSELVNLGFSPVPGTEQQRWTGPIRPSLRPLTSVTRMEIDFYDGWPLRYAHIKVSGLRTEHAADGLICLWAEDDPAQVSGRDPQVLWERLDQWAAAAAQGFSISDRALDAYLLFDTRNTFHAELPFSDLIRCGNNGFLSRLNARIRDGQTLVIAPGEPPETDEDAPRLRGAFYLRNDIGNPPRNIADVRAALTKRQRQDLDRGLVDRAPVGLTEPSGGYDFIVLAWPRHGTEHDAVVVGFAHGGASLQVSAMAASPNDTASRKRRAGPDADLLTGKTVLVAGAGSVGGHVALALASSGTGKIILHDDDRLRSGNLVRHVCPEYAVGFRKAIGVSRVIKDHAPWTEVVCREALSHHPRVLASQIAGVDLVVDCTGVFSVSAALAEVCRENSVPLVSGALFHKGALCRIQRQADGDTPLAARPSSPDYLDLPPEDPAAPQSGFLELGCMAPVSNASPIAVLSTAAEVCDAVVDFLTGRRHRSDERFVVFGPLQAPFDRVGTFDSPRKGSAA